MKLAQLTSKGRKHIAPSNFVFPKDKRYPIHDLAHARNALSRSSGTPDEAKVKAAVYRKYPQLKKRAEARGTTAAEAALNQRFRLEPHLIRLTEGDNGVNIPSRIQLFRTGTFKKLMPDGSNVQFSITRETLEEFVENWKNNSRGIDIALDFAHKSDEEAAGWFTNLYIEEAGGECQLWAEIDWTPDGRAAVGGKKFRYVSPDFAFAWTDNETGKRYGATLFGAGLTNRPVIKNMAPTVELTEVHDMAKKTQKKISKMNREELELLLSEEKDEQKKELIQLRLDEMSDDDDDDADDEEDKGKGQDDSENEESEDAPPPPKPKKKKSVDEMNMDELKKAHQKLLDEMAEVKKGIAKTLAESKQKEREAEFTVLCAEGKAVPAQKDAFLSGDVKKFAELAQETSFEAKGHGANVGKQETAAQDEVLRLADEKVTKARGNGQKLSIGDAISMVLSENPKLNTRYVKEMEGGVRPAFEQ